eukprot:9489622-Pyramimonas_sp.AAC.3
MLDDYAFWLRHGQWRSTQWPNSIVQVLPSPVESGSSLSCVPDGPMIWKSPGSCSGITRHRRPSSNPVQPYRLELEQSDSSLRFTGPGTQQSTVSIFETRGRTH